MKTVSGFVLVTWILLVANSAFGQYEQGGCITENPPPHTGPGYRLVEPPVTTYCAPPGGTILEDNRGMIVCAPGQCIDDATGQALCSREKAGATIIDNNRQIKCVGGCIRPSRLMCRVPQR